MAVKSIQVKIISVILAVLLISLGLSTYFTILNQRRNLIDAAQQTLAINTQVLNITIRNIMLSGEAPLATRTMGDLRNMAEFDEYELYRRDGTLAFSDYSTLNQVNSYQDSMAFPETPRLEGEIMDSESFREVVRFSTPHVNLDEANQTMEYFFPILNYADCRACHGDEEMIRGITFFRIPLDDVYARVNRAGRSLGAFFLFVGLFIFLWVLYLLRRIIIKPLFQIGTVVDSVGDGNLDLKIDLRQKDEMGRLAGRINSMIQGLKNSKLLELENTRIEARLEESRKYLDNINEGLLLLNGDFRITDEYSYYLKEIFEKQEIAGRSFVNFIYEDPTEGETRDLETFLNFLFHNKTASMDMIMDINPLQEFTVEFPGGKNKTLQADFQRIYQGEEVVNLMVLFQDITDILRTKEALEMERQTRQSELEQIAAILKLGPQVFEDFIQSVKDVISFIEGHRKELYRSDLLAQAFREVHSLKGTARYLKFLKLEDLAHRLEDHFAQFKDRGGALKDVFSDNAQELLEDIKKELEMAQRIIERFQQFSVGSQSETSEFDLFALQLEEMVQEISQDLDKQVELKVEKSMESIPGMKWIQPSLFHLVRNALDHGIEDHFQRLSLKKEDRALLRVAFSQQENMLQVEVEDDGQGLDFKALEQRGIETGLLKPGIHFPSQIANILFMSGFSSKEKVSRLSGRGVGLDAVKEDIQRLKGKINIKTKKDQGSTFILRIPLESLEE